MTQISHTFTVLVLKVLHSHVQVDRVRCHYSSGEVQYIDHWGNRRSSDAFVYSLHVYPHQQRRSSGPPWCEHMRSSELCISKLDQLLPLSELKISYAEGGLHPLPRSEVSELPYPPVLASTLWCQCAFDRMHRPAFQRALDAATVIVKGGKLPALVL